MSRNQYLRALLCSTLVLIFLCATPISTLASVTDLSVSAKSSKTEAARDKQLRPNGRGKQVSWFQSKLKKLGYYNYKVVSLYNKNTYNACKEFQACNGLKVTGIGNKETRQLASSKDAISRTDYDTEHNILSLKKGKTGAQVVYYQQQMINYGYLNGQPTGTFDSETVTATKYFQHANGKKITGSASRDLRKFINEGSKIVNYASYEALQMTVACKKGDWGLGVNLAMKRLKELGYYTGSIGYTYTTSMGRAVLKFEQFNNIKKPDSKLSKSDHTALHADNVVTYQQICGPDTIKPRTSGRKVLKIQVILKSLKYYKGPLNSKYDSRVVSAVKKFQKKYNQYPSGICYTPTLKLLEEKNPLSDVPDPRASVVIMVAQEKLGRPYVNMADGPNSFDCSGFTKWAFKQGTKDSGKSITLPHNSKAQGKKGITVALDDDLLPGDLVFFATGKNKKKLNHVGLVISVEGNIKFIHASSAAKKVMVSSFKDASSENFYEKRFLFGKRVW